MRSHHRWREEEEPREKKTAKKINKNRDNRGLRSSIEKRKINVVGSVDKFFCQAQKRKTYEIDS
jgi:hypothetical protein